MALFDDLTKGAATPAGLAAGIGALVLAPLILPTVSRLAWPVARAVLGAGIGLYRQTMEPLGEVVTELVAEARSELAAARAAGPDREDASPRA